MVPVPAVAMTADPLSPAVSDRICRHMNDDHASAVLAYAQHYAGLSSAQSARMVAVAPEAMTLEVDGASVDVPFDHVLTDSEDAHRTLVAMLRSIAGKD
jgi:putative heme iron utilization protein